MKQNLLCAMLSLYKENKKTIVFIKRKQDKFIFCEKKPSQITILERMSNNGYALNI